MNNLNQNDMKKTAVEWLYERLERMIPKTALYNIDKEDYFNQAKAMEKEQITLSHINGQSEFDTEKFRQYNKDLAEAYYNITFKSE